MRTGKAVAAAVVAAGTSLSFALDDGQLTAIETIAVVIATLVAYAGTWAVPNAPDPQQQRELEVIRARYSRLLYGGARDSTPPPLPPIDRPDIE